MTDMTKVKKQSIDEANTEEMRIGGSNSFMETVVYAAISLALKRDAHPICHQNKGNITIKGLGFGEYPDLWVSQENKYPSHGY
jgi:hypothetical protein